MEKGRRKVEWFLLKEAYGIFEKQKSKLFAEILNDAEKIINLKKSEFI